MKEKLTDAEKTRAAELDKMTFLERVAELRKENFMIGEGEATGIPNTTSAKRIPTGAVLTVIQDDWKYNINIDFSEEANFTSITEHVGEVLGVTFDTKDFEKTASQHSAIKEAQVAAKAAGGHFVLDK